MRSRISKPAGCLQALQKNEYIRYEDLPLKGKDGRLIQVEFVSNVYLVGGEKVIQCNIRDITERTQAQEALLKSEALLREQSVSGPFDWFVQPALYGRDPGTRTAASLA